MIDDLYTELLINSPQPVLEQSERPFYMNGLKFLPKWHDSGFISYYSQLENLRLKIFGNRLFLSNSWHKYFKGNNYSDYFLTEIEKTYYKLAERLGEYLEGGKIKRVAYGCVILENPYKNFPNWLYYKTKQPEFMTTKTGKRYGAKFILSDFNFKGYDKTLETWEHDKVRVDENLFRIECQVKHMRHLHNRKEPINIFNPKDIFNRDILNQLGDDLITKYKIIEKYCNMNLDGFTTHELNVIATMQNKAVREQFKQKHLRTYKSYKKLFNELTTAENAKYYGAVEGKIKSKFSHLINN